jgi:hypothetical protein
MTGSLLVGGWRTYVPVVSVNALLQSATTLPVATPAPSPAFIGLAVASFAALAASIVLTVAQAAASADGMRFRAPSLRLTTAGVLALVVIGLAAVLVPPVLVPAIGLALIVLPAIASGQPWFTGFRAFARRTGASIAFTLLCAVAIAVLWLGALLSGFFLAGAASALLTWLVIGAVGVALVCGWTHLTGAVHRPSSAAAASPVD